MPSLESCLRACRAGFDGYKSHGENATAKRCGFADPGIAWAFYIGQTAAKKRLSLKQAYEGLERQRRSTT